ncbi:hypothetical protein LguiA_015714 [Lonicera macranthoides]
MDPPTAASTSGGSTPSHTLTFLQYIGVASVGLGAGPTHSVYETCKRKFSGDRPDRPRGSRSGRHHCQRRRFDADGRGEATVAAE